MKKCENGHLMSGNFCPICGRPKKKEDTSTFFPPLREGEIKCRKCGEVQAYFHDYCTECGAGLRLK